MSIRSVAIYSEADTNALFAKNADGGLLYRPGTGNQSYLNMEKVITAKDCGADAIHRLRVPCRESKFASRVKRMGSSLSVLPPVS